ncbi:4695_t:CDS:1, partial [Entrophospora sp. SA101]
SAGKSVIGGNENYYQKLLVKDIIEIIDYIGEEKQLHFRIRKLKSVEIINK